MYVLKAIVAIVIVVLFAILLSGQTISADSIEVTPEPEALGQEIVVQNNVPSISQTGRNEISGSGSPTYPVQYPTFSWRIGEIKISYWPGMLEVTHYKGDQIQQVWDIFGVSFLCGELHGFQVAWNSYLGTPNVEMYDFCWS